MLLPLSFLQRLRETTRRKLQSCSLRVPVDCGLTKGGGQGTNEWTLRMPLTQCVCYDEKTQNKRKGDVYQPR